MSRSFDILIVGAGPAGSSLATRVARRGYDVALLDKKRFPRAKPCGEFLSPECAPLLTELGALERVTARAGRPVRGMRLYGYGHRTAGTFAAIGSSRVPHAIGGYAIAREILDAELLEIARGSGVAVLEGVACHGLLRDRGAVVGVVASDAGRAPFALRARWTVGADGVRSLVARELGVQRRIPSLDKFALTTHFDGVPASETAELHVFSGGYFAAAPIGPATLSLNLVVDRSRLRARNGSWDEFLADHLARAPELAQRLADARRVSPVRGVGPLAHRTTAQVFDGAALVGDACGYVDPMTGEGIWFALRTAKLLAAELDRNLASGREPTARALRRYASARRREILPRLLLSRLLQRGLRSETVARAMLRVLEARTGLADLLVSFTGDYVRYRDALRPDVWWRALTDRGAA
jgi:flavin-dependent dehydrogenase